MGGTAAAVPPLAGRKGPGEPFGWFPGRFFFSIFLYVAQKERWPPEAICRMRRQKRSTIPPPGRGGRSLQQQETVNCVRVQISTLKSHSALPAAPSEMADSRPAPACSPPRQCPLRFSARRTGAQGRSPAALFPRFLSRERNRAAGGALRKQRDPHSDPCHCETSTHTGERRSLRQEAVNCARVRVSILKSQSALPAAPSETADSRPAPACSLPRPCPLRFSARRTGAQGRSPAALFPRFLVVKSSHTTAKPVLRRGEEE